MRAAKIYIFSSVIYCLLILCIILRLSMIVCCIISNYCILSVGSRHICLCYASTDLVLSTCDNVVKFDVLLAGVFSHIRTECARDHFYVRFLLEGRSDLENI